VATINRVKITYDPAKDAANLKSWGLSFDQAVELDWTSAVIVEATRNDYGERRFHLSDTSENGFMPWSSLRAGMPCMSSVFVRPMAGR